MYRTTGAGKDARPPAMMAMAMLVQGYLRISDAEMIELTVLDLRVQMVLGCLGADEPPFSQGALQEFRERVIAPRWIGAYSNGPSIWRSRPRHVTTASCPRRCAWRSIRAHWRARDASKT